MFWHSEFWCYITFMLPSHFSFCFFSRLSLILFHNFLTSIKSFKQFRFCIQFFSIQSILWRLASATEQCWTLTVKQDTALPEWKTWFKKIKQYGTLINFGADFARLFLLSAASIWGHYYSKSFNIAQFISG